MVSLPSYAIPAQEMTLLNKSIVLNITNEVYLVSI